MSSASNFGSPWRREDFFGVLAQQVSTDTAVSVVGPIITTQLAVIGPFTTPAQVLLVDMVAERTQSAGIPGTFNLELRRGMTATVLRCVIFDNAVGARDSIRISPEGLTLPPGTANFFRLVYNDDSQGGIVKVAFAISFATFTSGGIE